MPKRVLIAPPAEAQIRAIDAWWRHHRKRSPELSSRELGDALSTLEVAPKAGRRPVIEIRRALIQRRETRPIPKGQ